MSSTATDAAVCALLDAPGVEEAIIRAGEIERALWGRECSPGTTWQALRDELATVLRHIVSLCGRVPLVVIDGGRPNPIVARAFPPRMQPTERA